MDGNKYLSRMDSLLKNNRLLGVVVFMLLVWNLMNWGAAAKMQSQTQVVVIPVGSEGMQIGNGRASERYMRRMSRYIINMLGSYTAASARDQFMELLDLFPPEKAGGVQIALEKIATDIERFPSISSIIRFSGENALSYTDDMLQIQARKQRLVNGAVTETKNVIYCLSYRIDGTRFWLLNVEEKSTEGVGSNENLCIRGNTSSAE